ncbi:hypothetical protein Btru_038211 [Bulinus truncatus]|nr:hypothetical protein Btru_038211 [Bulinus truncatus]
MGNLGVETTWQLSALEIHPRLESCKNEREEIRRRLAMSADDDISFGADDDSSGASETLSPRKQRLQARLQGAPSGMQICFMNDDVPDDEDDDEVLQVSATKDQPDEDSSGISLGYVSWYRIARDDAFESETRYDYCGQGKAESRQKNELLIGVEYACNLMGLRMTVKEKMNHLSEDQEPGLSS